MFAQVRPGGYDASSSIKTTIPKEELQIQSQVVKSTLVVLVRYKDDEGTFDNLRMGDSLNDAFRWAKTVSGTTFRRLELKVQWQP